MKQADEDSTDLLRLWMCRMFRPVSMIKCFITDTGFTDLDVAFALKLPGECYRDKDVFDSRRAKAAFTELSRKLEARSGRITAPNHWRSNLKQFGQLLNLNPEEELLLLLAAVQHAHPVLHDGFSLFRGHRQGDRIVMIARMLNLSVASVREALSSKGKLIGLGLIQWDKRSTADYFEIVHEEIAESLLSESFSLATAMRSIASLSPSANLSLNDYPHLEKTLVYLRSYLRSAVGEKLCGVNIYLYGAPGTGKSELARAIAQDIPAVLYDVATENAEGDQVSGARRLKALRLAQEMLSRQSALLVFDEAEDVFSGSVINRSIASEHKGWFNRMLENNRIPTLWISNACEGVDPAFLRRFDFIFEVSSPPRDQRMCTLRRICSDEVSEPTLEIMAECESLTPAVVARVNAVVARTCRGNTALEKDQAMLHLVRQTLKSQGYSTAELERDYETVPKDFDLTFLNCDHPLREISERMQRNASCRMCLYGPPGTGKSTFGHWLSRELGMPLHVKRASDLLSPYLGETEKRICTIFNEAKAAKAILMIDEVDSFLRDRRYAARSWEVSQVNELLTQMECYQGIFIATTNLMEGIDPASLRRFDLKVGFDFLNEDQTKQLLEKFCLNLNLAGVQDGPLEAIAAVRNLTPGDFANAVRQHRFRNFSDARGFLEALIGECKMKEGGPRQKLGF